MSAITEPALFTKLGFDPAYQSTFEDKLFVEGLQIVRRLTNFFTLLLLATVIATYGVLSNSTATVIGVMIVYTYAPFQRRTASRKVRKYPIDQNSTTHARKNTSDPAY